MEKKTYYCNCQEKCKGVRTKVGKTTYFAHKKRRNPESIYSPHLQQFLNQYPLVEPSTTASTSSHHPNKRSRLSDAGGIPDDVNIELISLRYSRTLTILRQDLSLDPAIERSIQPQASVDNDNDTSGPGMLDSIANASAETGVSSADNADLSEPAGDLEATQAPPPDGILDPPSDPGRACNDSEIPSSDVEDLWLQETIFLPDIQLSADFVRALRDATLSDPTSGLSSEALERLQNPLREQPGISEDLRLAIDLYLVNPSDATYESNRAAILRRFPEADVPSYYRIKRIIADITGIESLVHHMCINSCLAYTGPFQDKDCCPICSEPCYDQFRFTSSDGRDKIPRQEFHTIPIGPQLQALYREPESASHGHYLRKERSRILSLVESNRPLEEYSDLLHGSDLIEAFQDGRVGEDDIVLMFSIDGAQLYAKKASACWIYIWVLMNLAPDRRYKKQHVFIGGFIPGPNNPKNLDSFLFPGLQHLVALQKESLKIWDASLQREVESKVFLAILAADGPGMMHVTGLVGYHGKHGCRLYCGLSGRREPQGKHYFPALLKPRDYDVVGCIHPDIDIRNLPNPSKERYYLNLRDLVASRTETQYRARRLDTGISRPSIFCALNRPCTLGLPKSAGSDIMHLGALNLSDLMISLWRGTIDCTKPDDKASWDWAVLRGDVWQQHGKAVADCLHYLPGSFDRPPRNIAEKLTSGYKAWEFLLYLYGLGPGLLLGVLPDAYYTNYCKLVFGMRLMNQHKISESNVREAKLALSSFAQEFEMIYCQRLPTRIHFVRPCIHSLTHLPGEVIRLGPPICSSQWTLERTIGNLGEEIKQHSNPFANLSQRGIRRARVNALKSLIPDLIADKTTAESIPHNGQDIGDGYVLLRGREVHVHPLRDCEADALRDFLPTAEYGSEIYVRRWARLRLPTGQTCYSAWKEKEKPIHKRRTARNVKILLDGETRVGEVYFFINTRIEEEELTLALVSLYSRPDPRLLALSCNALWSCEYKGDSDLRFIDVKSITAVVAMIPHKPVIEGRDVGERFFLVEKPGLDVAVMSGIQEDVSLDEETVVARYTDVTAS